MDVLGLAQLQRRIKDEAQRKAKLRAREKENSLGYGHQSNNLYDDKKEIERNKEYSLKFDPGETIRRNGTTDTECKKFLYMKYYLKCLNIVLKDLIESYLYEIIEVYE